MEADGPSHFMWEDHESRSNVTVLTNRSCFGDLSLSVTLCFSSLIGSHTWDCLNFPPAQHSFFPFILGVELIVSSKKQHFHALDEERIYQLRARKVANVFQRSFTCIWNVGEQLSPGGLFKGPLVCAVIRSQRKCPSVCVCWSNWGL